MGRGLCSVEQRSDKMLLQLKTQFEKDRHRIIRRATILSVEKKKSSHLALIIPYLSNKYNISHLEIELPILVDAQKKYLYNKIKKNLHLKLYKYAKNPVVDCEASSIWLKKEILKHVIKQLNVPFKTGIYFVEIKVTASIVNLP
ncbi:hypothetical protein NUSPORA_01370 [Nucleospora cyclopteri]